MSEKKKPSFGKRFSSSLLRSVKNGTKQVASKANPLEQKINKDDISDSGVESIRLTVDTYKKGKNTIRTTKNTLRTTKRTIKTVKGGLQSTVRIVQASARTTVRVTTTVARATATAVTHVVAAAMNPLTWVLAGFGIIVYLLSSIVVILTGGAASQQQQQEMAALNPDNWGIDADVDLATAVSYYQIACTTQQQELYAIIDTLIYDATNLRAADLVYMERNQIATIWQKSIATPYHKNTLKSAWSIRLAEADAIAIVCTDYQRQMHLGTTEHQLYEMEFTQAQFDSLVDICAAYSHTQYALQECPDANCSVHTTTITNPVYTNYLNMVNLYADAYNAWGEIVTKIEYYDSVPSGGQSSYWRTIVMPAVEQFRTDYALTVPANWSDNNGRTYLNELGAQYEHYNDLLAATASTITNTTYSCDLQHTLHSIGLTFLDKDEVMAAYGFTESEIQWATGLSRAIRFYLAHPIETTTTTSGGV